MKKLFTIIAMVSLTITGMAQGKSNGKGHHKDKEDNRKNDDTEYKKNDDKYDDEVQDRKKRGDKNANYPGQNNNNDKYAKNVPSKVRAAFNRDYPNSNNVTWTKNRGYWTADMSNGIYHIKATYAANGQRINGTPTRRTSKNMNEGSVWDKILSKQ